MSFLLSWKSSQVCQSCAGSTLFKFTCLLTESICFNKISVSWARGSLFPLLFSIKEVLRQKQSFKLLASFIQSYLSSSTVISLFFPISAHAAILWTTYLHSAGWKLFTLLISAVSCIFTYWNASEWLKTSRYYKVASRLLPTKALKHFKWPGTILTSVLHSSWSGIAYLEIHCNSELKNSKIKSSEMEGLSAVRWLVTYRSSLSSKCRQKKNQ